MKHLLLALATVASFVALVFGGRFGDLFRTNTALIQTIKQNSPQLVACYLKCPPEDYLAARQETHNRPGYQGPVLENGALPQPIMLAALKVWSGEGDIDHLERALLQHDISCDDHLGCNYVMLELAQRFDCQECLSMVTQGTLLMRGIVEQSGQWAALDRVGTTGLVVAAWRMQWVELLLLRDGPPQGMSASAVSYAQGQLYTRLGDLERAKALFERALQTNDFSRVEDGGEKISAGLTLSALGDIYFQQGKLDLANMHYQQALAQDETLAPAYLGLAKVEKSNGRSSQAIKWLEDGVTRAAERGRIYLELGTLLRQEQRYDEALAWWQQGLETGAADYRHWLFWAVATEYARRGQVDLADTHYRSALALLRSNLRFWTDWLDFALAQRRCTGIEPLLNTMPQSIATQTDIVTKRQQLLVACGESRVGGK